MDAFLTMKIAKCFSKIITRFCTRISVLTQTYNNRTSWIHPNKKLVSICTHLYISKNALMFNNEIFWRNLTWMNNFILNLTLFFYSWYILMHTRPFKSQIACIFNSAVAYSSSNKTLKPATWYWIKRQRGYF